MENSNKFFQNRACPYFPCHHTKDEAAFNCLFCYCPLYALGDQCGGHFSYTKAGYKDCSGCLIPHDPKCYGSILSGCSQIMETVRKEQQK